MVANIWILTSAGWHFGFLVKYGFVLKPTANRAKQKF